MRSVWADTLLMLSSLQASRSEQAEVALVGGGFCTSLLFNEEEWLGERVPSWRLLHC